MCNELTTLMQVMEDPTPVVSDEDLLRFMEFTQRTINSQQQVLRFLHERLSAAEQTIEGMRNK